MAPKEFEIEVLDLEDLDVDELEQRLELAAAGGITPDGWICACDDKCTHCDYTSCPAYTCPCVSYTPPCSLDGGGCDLYGCGGGTQIP